MPRGNVLARRRLGVQRVRAGLLCAGGLQGLHQGERRVQDCCLALALEFTHCGVAHSDCSSTVDKSAEVQCPIGTSAPSGATKCVSLRTKQEVLAEQIYVVEKNKAYVSGLSHGWWVC